MKKLVLSLLTAGVTAAAAAAETGSRPYTEGAFAGSASCRQCHELFYQLWAPSHHGSAMQPYTAEFARTNLTTPRNPIKIGGQEYLACVGPQEGWVVERGPQGEKQFPIAHVMGGKNVYYFLTPMERGRLQTLPIAYDVRAKEWFDTAASGVRHFPHVTNDASVRWTDPMYTFNTSCHSCHVSQLSTNYDPKADSYRTTWSEPGINCETCHGPAQEHVRVCQAAPKGQTPQDLKIVSVKAFTVEQTNSMCGSCHAKMNPVSASFEPGDRYFDHFDLVALEHPDFYPDGRDLGENYTMTTWSMSPCVKSGKLSCVHCHTSSGRYRFKDAENPNVACSPCHQERVQNVASHTHHKADSTGNRCIACHMPMTDFARMTRSDHSMRPPAPAATLRFKSPNACNICHTDKDVAWADQQVRSWHQRDYQKTVLEQGALVEAARRGDWSRLDTMLASIASKDRDEVFAASLTRLLQHCELRAKWPVVLKALQEDSSPLVRAAAAETLGGYGAAESLATLARASGDEYRLVRVRAASVLAAAPADRLPPEHQSTVARATAELLEMLNARLDDYASQYNLGNYQLQRSDSRQALASYLNAIRLRPDFIPAYVNVAFAYNAAGENEKAEASFRKAIALDPNNTTVCLNLGMLLGEMNRPAEAEEVFRRVLQIDPNSAAAAYNLGVMLASDKPFESLRWCEKAYRLRPEDGKYGYTYAFFLRQRRETEEAVRVLKDMVLRGVPYSDAYVLLGTIYVEREESDAAAGVFRSASDNGSLTPEEREGFRNMLRRLEQGIGAF
ncbi:MAG: tetratricopeptide repeat protein [Solirubrobacterales bacterium]